MTVLIPRSPERGAGLARLIEAAGGRAVIAPLTEQIPARGADRRDLDDALRRAAAHGFDWVVVTSVNAVRAILAAPETARALVATSTASTASTQALRWAAVGPATARALADAGITADLVPYTHSAHGLLAEWPAPSGTGASRVLLPLGDLARTTLERGLAERGFEPVRVTAYRTVPRPVPSAVAEAWAAGRFDVVVLTSPSTVAQLAAQLGIRSDVPAVAIGEPTREAAESAGQRVGAVAENADDAGMLQALLRVADALAVPPPPSIHPEES